MKVVTVNAIILYRIVIVAMRMVRQMQVVIFIPNYLTETKNKKKRKKVKKKERPPEQQCKILNEIRERYEICNY